MPKPDVREPYKSLESDLFETMRAGLHEWRPDLDYPESFSDLQACLRAVFRMYEVRRRPVAIRIEDIELAHERPFAADDWLRLRAIEKAVTEAVSDHLFSGEPGSPKRRWYEEEIFNEGRLYDVLGKDDARTVLWVWRNYANLAEAVIAGRSPKVGT